MNYHFRSVELMKPEGNVSLFSIWTPGDGDCGGGGDCGDGGGGDGDGGDGGGGDGGVGGDGDLN